MAPRILFYDIETSANEGRFFGHYDVNPIEITRGWEMLSVAWKFRGEKNPRSLARSSYTKLDGDKGLVRGIMDVMEGADLVVAHNLSGFDNPSVGTRIAKHGLGTLPDVAIVDTLQIARKYFKFPGGNKLSELAKFFGVEEKSEPSRGLWLRCMDSDPAAFKEMAKYNRQDVVVLEAVFNKLAVHAKNIPDLNLLDPKVVAGEKCPNPVCLSKNIGKNGFMVAAKTRQQRYVCFDCGGRFKVAMKKGKKNNNA